MRRGQASQHAASWQRCSLLTLGVLVATTQPLPAADVDLPTAQQQFVQGEYELCIDATAKAIERRVFGEDWYILRAQAELAVGRADDAWSTVLAGLQRYQWSLRLRSIGRDVARAAGFPERATQWTTEIKDLSVRSSSLYGDPDSMVAIGRVVLELGADPKQVLEQLYDRALKFRPEHRDAKLASGELALAKQDYELAADLFRAAVKKTPDDPDFQLGLARSLQYTDGSAAGAAVAAALEANPRHVPSWLARAEQAIDAEGYTEAHEILQKILTINSRCVDAYALLAVLATLENDPLGAHVYRQAAFGRWPTNPRVDHLIGRKLSQKYRFAEGARNQQQAIAADPQYIPARIQLVQDYLRLGQIDDGWKLAENVHQQDGYDVQIFNLLELRDRLDDYTTLKGDGFLVRMQPREAKIYGDSVVALLQRARDTLCEKYGCELHEPVLVEIFPEPQDFAVRTFGMPGVSGYLGVCFGRVITANSPASQAEHPANWQAVLWHEFCHVVTLELTRNRMPRWLSEGISVYEERQADPSWGQRMSPRFREWILSGKMTPLDEMSGAFLSPPSPVHLEFAYFQSSLVVEFLMERYGLAALKTVLADLAAGITCDVALDRRCAPLKQLDAEFQDYARELARRFGPDLDWEDYDLSAIIGDDDPDRLQRWLDDHPMSFLGLSAMAQAHLEKRAWPQAQLILERLVQGVPEYVSPGGPYPQLLEVYRQQGLIQRERKLLADYVRRSDAPVPELLRLIELEQAEQNWEGVATAARKLHAVNPLLLPGQRAGALAAAKLDQPADAVRAWQAVLALDPNDRAEAHYQLAHWYERQNDPRAKREVLQALEIAPRYRAAQDLLLKLVDPGKQE